MMNQKLPIPSCFIEEYCRMMAEINEKYFS